MSNKTFDKIFPPTDEVRHFTHAGIKCMVRMGSWTINGYIELPEGHPWIGIGTWDHPADVHGGVTLSEGRVQGFDTSHSCDRPHPESPYAKKEFPLPRYLRGEGCGNGMTSLPRRNGLQSRRHKPPPTPRNNSD